MSDITFYWHDYETFGLNRRLDRPVQFAGLRTDENFNILGQPDVWYCEASPDYLPNPEACLVTGITPQVAHARGAVKEAELANRIEKVFSEPNTVSIGYNSLRFDDEITRFLFWRNLKDPYAREWMNNCSRWDLFPLVQAVWALRPEGINWPEIMGDDGKKRITFRLSELSAANHLEHTHAHDACSDVYATVALAKLIATKHPKLWQWALCNRSKTAISEAFSFSTGGRPVVFIDRSVGQERGFIRVLFPIWQKGPRTDIVAWDCFEDPSVLTALSAKEIESRAWHRAQLDEAVAPLALTKVRIGKFPFACPNLAVLKQSAVKRFGIDFETIAHNIDILREILPQIQERVKEASADKHEDAVVDADASLYCGFPSDSDRYLMGQLAKMTPEEIAEAIAQDKVHFADERLAELLWRKRARNWPETLSEAEHIRWKAFCAARLKGLVDGTLSLQGYFEEIDKLAEQDCEAVENGTLTDAQFEVRQQVLDDLYNWGEYAASLSETIEEGVSQRPLPKGRGL